MGTREDELKNRMKARRLELNRRNDAREEIEAEVLGWDESEPLDEYLERVMIDTFESYFRNREIEIDSLKFKKIPSAVFNDAFKECRRAITLQNGEGIDRNNFYLLEQYLKAYKAIVERYAIVAHPSAFCSLIGMELGTFDRWGASTNKTVVYVDIATGKSYTESAYRFCSQEIKDRCREVLTPSPRDLWKICHDIYKASSEQALNDSPLGLTVNANHSKRMGLEYAKQTLLDTAQVSKALSAGELPKLSLNAE